MANRRGKEDFLSLGSKITAGGDCSHEIRKTMANIDNVLKNRDITLLTKVHIVKTVVFPLVTYVCECWTEKRQNAKELMPSNHGVREDF